MPPSDSTKWMITSATDRRIQRYVIRARSRNQRESRITNGSTDSVTSASGTSSTRRTAVIPARYSMFATRSFKPVASSSVIASTSEVSLAMTRPEVYRS